MIGSFNNGDSNRSVRNKINSAINWIDEFGGAFSPTGIDTPAQLLLDETLTYAENTPRSVRQTQILNIGGFRYQVAASSATDHHITTAGGVKLYVLPGAVGMVVTAFGAKGDNSTDDTAAIQLAINTAAPFGYPVVFPAGTYVITTLTLPQQAGGIALRGEGTFTSRVMAAAGIYRGSSLRSTATTGDVISADGGASYTNRGIEISGLNITGVTSDFIINIEASPDNNLLARLGVYNLNASGGSGMRIQSAWVNTRIVNVNCEASVLSPTSIGLDINNTLAAGGFLAEASRWGRFGTGVLFGANTYQAKFLCCGMEGNVYGFRGTGGALNSVCLDTCHFEYNEDHAIWVEKVNSFQADNCTFFRNSEDASGTAADIFVSGAASFENYNVRIANCRNFGLSTDATFVYVQNSALNSGEIVNNQLTITAGATGTTGINIQGAGGDHWRVDGNFFDGAATPYAFSSSPRYFARALGAAETIRFAASPAASTDANTLDAYEEGNWTPVLNGDGAAPSGQAYVRQVGRYQRIGNRVYFTFDVELSTEGTVNGSAAITGLPFTVSSSPGAGSGWVSNFTGLNVSVVSLLALPNPNSTLIYLRHLTAAATGTTIVTGATMFTDTTRIVGGGCYVIA